MIFLNLLNRIFGPKKPLSRQEIEDYKSGAGNSHDTESKAAGSEFNDEALEGWKNSTSSVHNGMLATDQKMNEFINNTNGGGTTKKGMTLSFILFTLTMLTLIIFTYQGNSAVEKKPQIVQELENKEEIENVRDQEIDFYTAISPEKQITSNELIKNQDIQKTEAKVLEEPVPDKENKDVEIDKTQNENIQLPIQSSGKIPNSNKSTLSYKIVKEVYLSELKNVDYRAYRSRPIKVHNDLNVGLPANQSSKEDKQEFPSLQTTEITYIDYLRSTSEIFSQGKYKEALKNYLTILKTYPNDVNANFYGGLCYFNLGQFSESIDFLNKSYTLGYGNFREEARWFSARVFLEQNKKNKANRLLKEIIEEGGFYSEHAKVLLNL
ncbi:tetratricopeptide repeat protein [Brumimicrobium mesophilum]|uniref:tetratricopeptide repeat protein n=1 Tax=Brumimicrobium mesophilum TaxID=392717 RepID=UPI000D140A04|nr:hypothetical protein [Brumimicrobium mesophilum]